MDFAERRLQCFISASHVMTNGNLDAYRRVLSEHAGTFSTSNWASVLNMLGDFAPMEYKHANSIITITKQLATFYGHGDAPFTTTYNVSPPGQAPSSTTTYNMFQPRQAPSADVRQLKGAIIPGDNIVRVHACFERSNGSTRHFRRLLECNSETFASETWHMVGVKLCEHGMCNCAPFMDMATVAFEVAGDAFRMDLWRGITQANDEREYSWVVDNIAALQKRFPNSASK